MSKNLLFINIFICVLNGVLFVVKGQAENDFVYLGFAGLFATQLYVICKISD